MTAFDTALDAVEFQFDIHPSTSPTVDFTITGVPVDKVPDLFEFLATDEALIRLGQTMAVELFAAGLFSFEDLLAVVL